jgi:hypothetical protein
VQQAATAAEEAVTVLSPPGRVQSGVQVTVAGAASSAQVHQARIAARPTATQTSSVPEASDIRRSIAQSLDARSATAQLRPLPRANEPAPHAIDSRSQPTPDAAGAQGRGQAVADSLFADRGFSNAQAGTDAIPVQPALPRANDADKAGTSLASSPRASAPQQKFSARKVSVQAEALQAGPTEAQQAVLNQLFAERRTPSASASAHPQDAVAGAQSPQATADGHIGAARPDSLPSDQPVPTGAGQRSSARGELGASAADAGASGAEAPVQRQHVGSASSLLQRAASNTEALRAAWQAYARPSASLHQPEPSTSVRRSEPSRGFPRHRPPRRQPMAPVQPDHPALTRRAQPTGPKSALQNIDESSFMDMLTRTPAGMRGAAEDNARGADGAGMRSADKASMRSADGVDIDAAWRAPVDAPAAVAPEGVDWSSSEQAKLLLSSLEQSRDDSDALMSAIEHAQSRSSAARDPWGSGRPPQHEKPYKYRPPSELRHSRDRATIWAQQQQQQPPPGGDWGRGRAQPFLQRGDRLQGPRAGRGGPPVRSRQQLQERASGQALAPKEAMSAMDFMKMMAGQRGQRQPSAHGCVLESIERLVLA